MQPVMKDPPTIPIGAPGSYPAAGDVRDLAPTCVFHASRAAVRNGMCEPCAEMADDAR